MAKYSKDKRALDIIESRKRENLLKGNIERKRREETSKQAQSASALQQKIDEQKRMQKMEQERIDRMQQRANLIQRAWNSTSRLNDTILPKYKNGVQGWNDYLQTNFINKAHTSLIDTTGSLIVRFDVDNSGGLSNIVIDKGLGISLDTMLLTCIKQSSGFWRPARYGSYVSKSTTFTMWLDVWYQSLRLR